MRPYPRTCVRPFVARIAALAMHGWALNAWLAVLRHMHATSMSTGHHTQVVIRALRALHFVRTFVLLMPMRETCA